MLTLLFALHTPALACANLVHTEGELAESDGQEAILWTEGDDTLIEYLVSYDGDAADFGWVVPIPGEFVSLQDGDQATFDALRGISQPTVMYISAGEDDPQSGCACGPTMKDNAARGLEQESDLVDIVAEGFTGNYSYQVVQGDNADDVLSWLGDQGWDLGPTEPSLSEYVTDGGYQFVLVDLLPDAADTAEGGRYLPPVRIAYGGDDLRFPARMARHIPVVDQRTTLFVVGDQEARITSDWSTEEHTIIDANGGTGEEVWERWLLAHDGSYTLTYSGALKDGPAPFNGQWLTRFDTLSSGPSHTSDVTFALDGGEDPFEVTIEVWNEAPSQAWLLAPLFLGLLARRRDGSRGLPMQA